MKPAQFKPAISVFNWLAATCMVASCAAPVAARARPVTPSQNQADAIIYNARIYTASDAGWQSAIAIKGGKILKVGSDAEVKNLTGAQTKVQDGEGRLILPGLHDCHVHLAEGGAELLQCRLNSATNQGEVLELLKKWAAVKHPGDDKYKWILAAGLPLPAVAAAPLTCQILDSVSSTRPLLVYAEDGHSAWLNSKAMQMAGITAASTAPCGGIVELDLNGQPTGCLREGALALVQKVLPVLSLKERSNALANAIALANSFGITSAQDAHANEEVLTAYYDLAKRKKLNLKVVAALHTGVMTPKAYDRLEKQAKKYSQYPRLQAHSAKIFADGVVESHTAALLTPYLDQPEKRGDLNYSPEELKAIVKELDRRGFQIHIHAIGDRAVQTALDAFEAKNTTNDLRHQIAHLQLVHPDDYGRFKALNITANCQAAWAFQDKYIKDLTAPLLGDERMSRVYPFGSLKNAGARLAAGSDWTVSTLNPLDAMQVAVTRQSYELAIKDAKNFEKLKFEKLKQEAPLNAEQKIALQDIVGAYTTGGAYVNHSEGQTGSLEAGKTADLVMLDKNIFELPVTEIAGAKVVWTMVDGDVVYEGINFN